MIPYPYPSPYRAAIRVHRQHFGAFQHTTIPAGHCPLCRRQVALPNAPAFDWAFGCSATAAAMLMGYYDNSGYSNMYDGPANGGFYSLTNAVWGAGECPLSATHQGYDSLSTRGHTDDYWVAYGSADRECRLRA